MIACMELRSEHACATAVYSREAIAAMANKDKVRFDMNALFRASQ